MKSLVLVLASLCIVATIAPQAEAHGFAFRRRALHGAPVRVVPFRARAPLYGVPVQPFLAPGYGVPVQPFLAPGYGVPVQPFAAPAYGGSCGAFFGGY